MTARDTVCPPPSRSESLFKALLTKRVCVFQKTQLKPPHGVGRRGGAGFSRFLLGMQLANWLCQARLPLSAVFTQTRLLPCSCRQIKYSPSKHLGSTPGSVSFPQTPPRSYLCGGSCGHNRLSGLLPSLLLGAPRASSRARAASGACMSWDLLAAGESGGLDRLRLPYPQKVLPLYQGWSAPPYHFFINIFY